MKKYLITFFIFVPILASAQGFEQDLFYGLKANEEVKELQEFLTDKDFYSGPITGNFFSLTLSGVKNFQAAYSITPISGYFGPKSRAKANELLAASGISEKEIATESGVAPAPAVATPKTNTDVVNSLMEQIKLLQQQLALLQQQQTTLQQQNQQFAQQTQTLQQIQQQTAPAPQPPPVLAPIPPPPADNGLIFSATAERISLSLGLSSTKTTIEVGGYDSIRIITSVKYLTKSLNGLVVNVTTPDSSQNTSWTLGNYQSTTLTTDYRPKTVGQHTITVTAADKTQTLIINAIPYVDIPPTLSLRLPQSGTTFIQPPQTSAIIATLACQYSIEKASHSVNPGSLAYEVISTDLTKTDLSLKVQSANNPDCVNIVLNPLPLKGGKFQIKITGLKFYAAGVESSALGLPIMTAQYEVRDPNTITLWQNYVPKTVPGYEGQMITTRSPIVYVGGHLKATLQFNWTGPQNNTGGRFSYTYTQCNNLDSCDRESDPIYVLSSGTPTGETAGGSFAIPLTPGYNYARISIPTPPGGVLNATLLLE